MKRTGMVIAIAAFLIMVFSLPVLAHPIFQKSEHHDVELYKVTNQKEAGDVWKPGDEITYTIMVFNWTESVIPIAAFSDVLPQEITYVQGSAKAQNFFGQDMGTIAYSEGAVNWLGSLPPRIKEPTNGGENDVPGFMQITYKATINQGLPNGTVISNQGEMIWGEGRSMKTDRVEYENGEPVIDNSSQEPTVIVVGEGSSFSEIIFSKTAYDNNREDLLPGDTITYAVSVTNNTGNDIESAKITDGIPDNTLFSEGTIRVYIGAEEQENGSFGYDADRNEIRWQGAIEQGPVSTVTMTFQVLVCDVPEGTKIINQAELEYGDKKIKSHDPSVEGKEKPTVLTVGSRAELGLDWYLGEGYTGPGFDTWVLISNDGETDASVILFFQLKEGEAQPYSLTVQPNSRTSIRLNDLNGLESADVSTMIRSNVPIVVERAMYFDYMGSIKGGHDTIGSTVISEEWFFGEGYTGPGFDTWILVANPGEGEANVTLRFQLPAGNQAEPYSFSLGSGKRQSICLGNLPGLESTDVSTTIESDQPVVAERAVYFNYNDGHEIMPGGHNTIGAYELSEEWFFGEGYTGPGFDTWILVANPNNKKADVTIHFQLPSGTANPYTFVLQPGERKSIKLNAVEGLESTDVSARVKSLVPVVAERAVYFIYGDGIRGGHNTIGASGTSLVWSLPEGYTAEQFDTWILVANPGETAANIRLSFQLPQGKTVEDYTFVLEPGTRRSVSLDHHVPGLEATEVGTTVISDNPVVSERSVYFVYAGRIDGGHCSIGYAKR